MRPRPWRHWTVRARIVVSVVTLAGVALIAANAIGVGLLNWYLMQRIDDQLEHSVRPPGVFGGRNPNLGASPNPSASSNIGPVPNPSATVSGTRRDRYNGEFAPGPLYQIYRFDSTGKLKEPLSVVLDPALFGDIRQRAEQPKPFTVTTPDGEDWRVIVFLVPAQTGRRTGRTRSPSSTSRTPGTGCCSTRCWSALCCSGSWGSRRRRWCGSG